MPTALRPLTNVPDAQDMILVRNTTPAPLLVINQYVPSVTLAGDPTITPYPIPNISLIVFLVKDTLFGPDGVTPTPDSAALLMKDNQGVGGVVNINAALGIVQVNFAATDLSDASLFPDNVPLRYAVKLYVTPGVEQVVAAGNFFVTTLAVLAP